METKVCKKCGIEKSVDEFYTNQSHCKKCVNEQCRKYYAKNRDKVNEHQRKYIAENRDKVSERKRKWYAKNRKRDFIAALIADGTPPDQAQIKWEIELAFSGPEQGGECETWRELMMMGIF